MPLSDLPQNPGWPSRSASDGRGARNSPDGAKSVLGKANRHSSRTVLTVGRLATHDTEALVGLHRALWEMSSDDASRR